MTNRKTSAHGPIGRTGDFEEAFNGEFLFQDDAICNGFQQKKWKNCEWINQNEVLRKHYHPYQKEKSKYPTPDGFWWNEKMERPDARYEILHFRTEKCAFGDQCPRKDSGYCDRVHHFSQARRCPVHPNGQLRYVSVRCQYMVNDWNASCPLGDDCGFAHTAAEVSNHPFVYRTKGCPNHSCKDMCCPFAHSHQEIREGMKLCGGEAIKLRYCSSYPDPCTTPNCTMAHSRAEIDRDLLTEEEENYATHDFSLEEMKEFLIYRFKTLYCPLSKTHGWQTCPYAHNFHDFRRSPRECLYSPLPCVNWQNGKDSCPSGHACSNAHGLKESLYHPNLFRTKQCSEFELHGSCLRGKLCAYRHDDLEASTASTKSQDDDEEEESPSNTPSKEKIRDMFLYFDADRDGMLSRDVEMRCFLEIVKNIIFADEDYSSYYACLGEKMAHPGRGLSLDEFHTQYASFGSKVVDRDYNIVFAKAAKGRLEGGA